MTCQNFINVFILEFQRTDGATRGFRAYLAVTCFVKMILVFAEQSNDWRNNSTTLGSDGTVITRSGRILFLFLTKEIQIVVQNKRVSDNKHELLILSSLETGSVSRGHSNAHVTVIFAGDDSWTCSELTLHM